MSSFDAAGDKEYEKLNEAIMRAITSSKEVKQVLLNFKKKNLINNLAVFNLILSLEELSEMIFASPMGKIYQLDPADHPFPTSAPSQNAEEPQNSQRIDGKQLSQNEILFEEYFRLNFDEKEWLKKARLRF